MGYTSRLPCPCRLLKDNVSSGTGHQVTLLDNSGLSPRYLIIIMPNKEMATTRRETKPQGNLIPETGLPVLVKVQGIRFLLFLFVPRLLLGVAATTAPPFPAKIN